MALIDFLKKPVDNPKAKPTGGLLNFISKPMIPKGYYPIKAEDDAPEGTKDIRRIGGQLYASTSKPVKLNPDSLPKLKAESKPLKVDWNLIKETVKGIPKAGVDLYKKTGEAVATNLLPGVKAGVESITTKSTEPYLNYLQEAKKKNFIQPGDTTADIARKAEILIMGFIGGGNKDDLAKKAAQEFAEQETKKGASRAAQEYAEQQARKASNLLPEGTKTDAYTREVAKKSTGIEYRTQANSTLPAKTPPAGVTRQIGQPEINREISSLEGNLPQTTFESQGGVPGERGLNKVGLGSQEPEMITRSEDVLLKERLRNQARGARVGYKAGQQEAKISITNQLKNTFETKIEDMSRANELGALKTKIKVRDWDRVKDEIVEYAKENIPVTDRGAFLNMVKDAKTQKDLAKAFVRIDAKSEEVLIKQSISDLKKIVENATDSNSVSADYRVKIKDVIDDYELQGHNKGTIEKLKATQDYINRQASLGEEVELPQRIINKLKILERTPKDKLTLKQIQALQSEVELLSRLGETKWSSKQALYNTEKELRKNELLASATSIKSRQVKNIGLEKSLPKYVETFIKARNYLQKTNVGITPIEGLADITGMQPLKEVMDLNFGNYLTYNDDVITQWYELAKGLDESNFKRIGAYAISEQTGGIERLANNGITAERVAELKLTPEEIKVYKFARESFDKEFPAVKKYALDNYNKDVGEVKNYVSFMADHDAMSELEMYDRFGTPAEFPTNTKTVEQGFTEKRQALSQQKLELNIDKIFRRHMDDVAYMLTMGRDIKQYFEIVNSPEMREKLGDVGSLAWLQYLDLMARKGGSEGAKRIVALDILRKNLSAGVLAFRLSSVMVQLTSFSDTMGTMGAEWAMKGASSIATSKEWRNFVMDNFPEVRKAVGDDLAFREFGDGYLAKATAIGFTPLQALDGLMRSTAISAAYQKLAAAKGIAVDFANPDKELIQQATKLMRQSQGSSFFKDQPLSISTSFGLTDNKSVNKTLLTFQSFMLNRWDNMQRQIWRLGIKEKDYKKASMSFLWLVLVAAAMEEGIRRGTKKGIAEVKELATGEEAEENKESFAGNAALNVVQSVPIAGSLISSMMYSSNPIPVVNTAEQFRTGLTSVWGGKALETKIKGGISALGAGASLLGIAGSSQAAQIAKGLVPEPKTKGDIAEKAYQDLLKSPTAKADFDKIIKENPDLAKDILKAKEKLDLGITKQDEKTLNLGVENKERANFVLDKLNSLKTKEEKAKLWEEYVKKKIITKKVSEQLLEQMSKNKSFAPNLRQEPNKNIEMKVEVQKTLEDLLESNQELKQAKPRNIISKAFDFIKEKLPFADSNFSRAVKNNVLKTYHFTDEAKKVLEEIKIKDISPVILAPFAQFKDKEAQDLVVLQGANGYYEVKGTDIYQAIDGIIGEENTTKLYNSKYAKLVEFFDKEDINLEDSSATVAGHEILHAFFERSSMGGNREFKEDRESFFSDWQNAVSNYPVLAEIDEHLKEHYSDVDDYGLDTERFAYLGEKAIGGIEAIPEPLRKYYKTIFK